MKNTNSVPVLSIHGKPLMPTTSAKARKLIKEKKATPFYKLNVFCIRLNYITQENKQDTIISIDPGSKKEAYTIRSYNSHYLNIQCDAKDDVKDKMKTRAEMRRGRRGRKTPCRQPRWANRKYLLDRLAPSTKARWQLKINLIKKLNQIYPLTHCKIEDIKAESKPGAKRWNNSFSPLQCGKKWFKKTIKNEGLKFSIIHGWQTAQLRKKYKLSKTKNKMSEEFDAHVVDSAVIAANYFSTKKADENTNILIISPIKFDRRSLHKLQVQKGSKRPLTGGIRNKKCKLTKGSILKVKNKNGFYLCGGFDFKKNKLTICSLDNQSSRISRSIDVKDIKFLSYNRYTFRNNNKIKSKNK